MLSVTVRSNLSLYTLANRLHTSSIARGQCNVARSFLLNVPEEVKTEKKVNLNPPELFFGGSRAYVKAVHRGLHTLGYDKG